MNTMSMPGFTAEDSLYRSRTQYTLIASKFLGAKADIRPQLPRLPWPWPGPKNCVPGCYCVIAEGCPCCKSWPWPWPQPMDEPIF